MKAEKLTIMSRVYEDGTKSILCYVVYHSDAITGKRSLESLHLTEDDAKAYLKTCPENQHDSFYYEEEVMHINCRGDKK